MATKTKREWHAHVCTQCKWRYPDACEQPDTNSVCITCRSGRRSVHQQEFDPRDCCRKDSAVVNKFDIKLYRLRGKAPWWICRTCCRQFGYDPRNPHA